MESLTLRQSEMHRDVRTRPDPRRGRVELPSFQVVGQFSSREPNSVERSETPMQGSAWHLGSHPPVTHLAPTQDQFAREFGGNQGQMQRTPQSPPHSRGDPRSGINLPPIRQIIPDHFSPPQTPDHGQSAYSFREPSSHGYASKPIPLHNKRAGVESILERARDQIYQDGSKRERMRYNGDYASSAGADANRTRFAGRSPSEYSYTSVGMGSASSDSSNGHISSSRHSTGVHLREHGRAPALETPYASPRVNASLPPISSFAPGQVSTESSPYGPPLRAQNPHAVRGYGHGAYEPAQPDGDRLDRRWDHRTSSVAYPYHEHADPYGDAPRDPHREKSYYTWDVPSASDGPFQRKRRGNLPKDATAMFKKWYDEHRDSPYPSEDEKMRFCRETGLTMNQVGNWFINARRRQPNKSSRESSSIDMKDEG